MHYAEQTLPAFRPIATPFTAVEPWEEHDEQWLDLEADVIDEALLLEPILVSAEYMAHPVQSLPLFRPEYGSQHRDPLSQRAIILMTSAILLILVFALWVGPWRATAVNQDTTDTDTAVAYASLPGATAGTAATGAVLAPLFTPEVHYWEDLIVRWAQTYDVDPNMVATIMQIESCGNPEAVSRANAQGLFQVMPFHFQSGENMRDPELNAQRGVNYFAERLVQTNGDVGRAFAGYNGGHVAAAAGWSQWAAETQRYYTWSTGIYADAQQGNSSSETLQRWLAAGGDYLCRQAATQLGLSP